MSRPVLELECDGARAMRMTNTRTMTGSLAIEEGDLREWLELALGAGGFAAWKWEPVSGRLAVSEEVEALIGMPIGSSLEDLLTRVHVDDRGLVAHTFECMASGDTALDLTFRALHSDGSIRWIQATARPAPQAPGQLSSFLGVLRDVTTAIDTPEDASLSALMAGSHDAGNPRSAENDSSRTEQRYKSLLANIPEVTWTADASGRAVYISPNIEWVFGFTQEEIYRDGDRLWFGRIHPDDRERVRQEYQRLFDCEEPFDIEYRIRRKDGVWIWWHARAARTYERDGLILADGLVSDVTARRHAEEALRESEERLRLALEAGQMGSWDWDVATGAVSWSPRLERMHGLEPGTFEGTLEAFERHIHPDDRERVLDSIRRTLDTGIEYHLEYRIVGPDGSIRWLEPRGRVIHDSQGRPIRMTGVCQDITERKEAEAALRESERRYRLVVERNLAGFFRSTLDGRLLECNDSFARIFGYDSKEQLLALSTLGFYFDAADRDRYVEQLHKHGSVSSYEIRLRRRDGSPVWVIENVTLATNDGAPPVLEGTLVDITDKKLAGEALARARELAHRRQQDLLFRLASVALVLGTARDLTSNFRALVDFLSGSLPCSAIFVALYDPERRQRTCVYAWSEGVEIDVSDLPVMPMTDNPMSRAIDTCEPIIVNDFERVLSSIPHVDVAMDVNPCPARSSLVVPMAAMGRVVGAVDVQCGGLGAFTEEHVTVSQMAANLAAVAIENVRLLEREREHQERLRVSQRLEAVGRLAGGVAHDFNNLLTVITGYSDMMLRRLSECDPLRADAEEIHKAAERAASLTGQLLAFSRKQVLQPKVLSLNELVVNLERMLRRLIGEDIELLLELDPELPNVEADPSQLEQVIMNLAVNARDAMPGGGRLTISTATTEWASVSETGGDGVARAVALTVTDTGLGMDDQTRAHIFEPFFTTKEIGQGTGLGLATVYGIVEQSLGRVEVESEPGAGASFRVLLPAAAAALEPREEAPEVRKCQGAETILLVEDESALRQLAALALRDAGYRVIEAPGGGEALELAEAFDGRVDLVLSDVVMPQMSGRVLVERLAERRPGVKVLFMSGYMEDDVVRRGAAVRDVAFLAKPFSIDGLVEKVREVLDEVS